MIEKVLVPLDGSELAEQALHTVPRLFGSVELLLFRVMSPPDVAISAYLPDTARTTREMTQAREGAAEAYLAAQREAVEGEAVSVETEAEFSHDPAREIVRLAEERGCDVIVMSTHGRSGLTRALVGSVTDRVLRRSSVPVVVVPPEREEGGEE